ncbi:MAG: hypothetical protein IIA66_11875 [Planctomycetes bacterium]|nr:hypothetical protein [Planctomycetota bacterium]
MRCKNCDYRLWNLKSRQCPECGTPFLPSEFEFLLNSIQFCCPHCNQSYYGTGEKGHLVPVQFACVSCKQQVHMDDMVVLPTAGVDEDETKLDHMPWQERHRTSTIKAWFATVGRALVAPGRLIRSVPVESSVSSAVWFAIITNTIVFLASSMTAMILPLIMALSMSGMGPTGGGPMGPGMPGPGAMAAAMAAGVAGIMGAGFLIVSMLMLVTGLVAHGLLRLTGETQSTIGRTFHAICYSSGANVVTAIPCFGMFFGWIWWLISAILMIRTGQKVHGGRAAFAVLTIPVLALGTIIGFYTWMIVSMMSGTGPFAMADSTSSTETILVGLLNYAEERDEMPEHAIQLVAEGFAEGFDMVATQSDTFEEDVPVADTNLDKFTKLPSEDISKAVQAAIDALPAGTTAHRLGDFVFTYHGINLANADPGLWLVIESPDPDVNPAGATGTVTTSRGPGMTTISTTSSGGMVVVGLADGSVTALFSRAFSAQLSTQNALRATYNLPPLPDPATVTHTKPAVAGNQPQSGEMNPDPPEPDDSSSAEDENP